MEQKELIPHLFRTEYSKLVSVLSKTFGLDHIEIAEDIVSDTFMIAVQTWVIKGIPENPTAWLYTVAKNKTKDFFKHNSVFQKKIVPSIRNSSENSGDFEIDLSNQNITDSQLQMMFAICHPSISSESQIGLSLNILCGFGVEEIADAFLSNKETIYKRLARAKEKLKAEKIDVAFPPDAEIKERLDNVLTTLYLLFSEGYYSHSQNITLRKDFCVEAMRLTLMLIENELTNIPEASALMALMCFHASRFDARLNKEGEIILYEQQDENLWNKELIERGELFLNQSSTGTRLSKYHLEAGIAYWHTIKEESREKWESILQLYNKLLQVEYSPIAALNRTYALSKANGKEEAIKEAEKLDLNYSYLYHGLLGELYTGIHTEKALTHLEEALRLCKNENSRKVFQEKIAALNT